MCCCGQRATHHVYPKLHAPYSAPQSIKASLGRDDFRVEARRLWRMLLAHGYQELPLTGEHAAVVEHLPWLHKDPFDRILVAQSRVESMTLLTSDTAIAKYGEGIQLI